MVDTSFLMAGMVIRLIINPLGLDSWSFLDVMSISWLNFRRNIHWDQK